MSAARTGTGRSPNGAVLAHYVSPYIAYVLVLAVPANLVPRAATYALAGIASAVALAVGWRAYLPLRGEGSLAASTGVGVVAGAVGTVLWVAMKAPFYPEGGVAWAPAAFWARAVASSTVVPVFEELLFRGVLLLGVLQWDQARRAGASDPLGVALNERSVADVAPGAWTTVAVAVSTIAFAAGHAPGEWLAASAYGLLMSALWVARKDLITCVVAHATTNATLAAWVRVSGEWNVW